MWSSLSALMERMSGVKVCNRAVYIPEPGSIPFLQFNSNSDNSNSNSIPNPVQNP